MDFHPVTEFVEEILRKEKGVPGCALRVMRNHQEVFRYSSGYADYEGKRPVHTDDLYIMYSCTKPVTCTAAMQLVERGTLELDAPVSRYLPEFADVFVMRDGKKAVPATTMTIRHLFTMSAGLNYDVQAKPILELMEHSPKASTREIVNALIQSPLDFEPGEKYQYSMCHDVLAAVIEVITGMKFSEYLQKNIFAPLGMKRTGFDVPAGEKHLLAAQYQCDAPGSIFPVPIENAFRIGKNHESGGAGLISCIDDYILFADAMANGGVGKSGGQILKPETIDLMRTEQLRSFAADPRFSYYTDPGYGYGLGVRTRISRSQGQRSAIGEFGWDGAAGSYILMDPAYGLSIVFTMQVRNWPVLLGDGHERIRDLAYECMGL